MPGVQTHLRTYEIDRVSVEALVKVLIGDMPTQGVLPCATLDVGM